jgi:hypothetical protein
MVKRMVESLPEPYRQALMLTEFEGLSQVALAQQLAIATPVQAEPSPARNWPRSPSKAVCNREGGLVAWEKSGHKPEPQKYP